MRRVQISRTTRRKPVILKCSSTSKLPLPANESFVSLLAARSMNSASGVDGWSNDYFVPAELLEEFYHYYGLDRTTEYLEEDIRHYLKMFKDVPFEISILEDGWEVSIWAEDIGGSENASEFWNELENAHRGIIRELEYNES